MPQIPAKSPDFIIAGAPKCATSSLHLLLIRHPDIFMTSPKEPHFFSTDLPGLAEVPDHAAYAALYDGAPDGATLGEASAFYLSSHDAPGFIHAANPDTKIILSLRNPVDAAYSWFHQLRDGFREDQKDFAAAWDLQAARAAGGNLPSYCPEPAQLQYGRIYSYHDQVARYFDVFGRDAVKVLRFEDIKSRPDEVVAELLSFIGVAPFEAPVALPKTNTRRKARFPAINQFLSSPPPVLRPLMRPVKAMLNRAGIKPSEFVMKHLSKETKAANARLDPEMRARLQAYFAADVAKLETLIEQDLSAWRK